MSFPQITNPAQDNAPEVLNRILTALDGVSVYAQRQQAHSGLTWGYYGGRWSGFSVSDATLTLANNATNYIVVEISTGAISVSSSNTNWNSTSAYRRVYQVTTVSGAVTAIQDHRAGANGVLGGVPPTGGGGTVGRHAIYLAAASMIPSATGGCAALATIASAANQPDISTLDFDATTQEYAQFGIVMPKSWNEGTVTFVAHWSHAATTTNFGVVFDLQAVAVANDDPIAVAFGTAQTVTDTGGTTNDLYTSPESSAITVAGSPGAEEMVFFRLSRVTGNGSDTMAIDARLHGITLYITTDAENDA